MVANYTVNITVDNVIDALATFIKIFIPANGQVVRGQVNRVSPPPNPFVELTELFEVDLNVPYDDFQGTAEITNIQSSTKIDVQVDFYGANAGDYCKAVKSALRTEWGYAQFPKGVKPLTTDDGRQMPLKTGEQQYLTRWTLTASLQYNPVVTVPQQSAKVLTPTVEPPVDIFDEDIK